VAHRPQAILAYVKTASFADVSMLASRLGNTKKLDKD
jgi:hypothetical protein